MVAILIIHARSCTFVNNAALDPRAADLEARTAAEVPSPEPEPEPEPAAAAAATRGGGGGGLGNGAEDGFVSM